MNMEIMMELSEMIRVLAQSRYDDYSSKGRYCPFEHAKLNKPSNCSGKNVISASPSDNCNLEQGTKCEIEVARSVARHFLNEKL